MSIQGKTVVFTGKISKPRHEFQALVEKHGGIAGSDVSSHTDYLVVGEKPGSKLMRAATLGIKMLSEVEFLRLLEPVDDGDEPPLSRKNLEDLDSKLVTLTCSHCNKEYRQWASLPDYSTCPLCEILIPVPLCPHCGSKPIFVTDFGFYRCMLCGTWYKAPRSMHARSVKHICWTITVKEVNGKVIKRCLACGNTIAVPKEDIELSREKYNEAPLLVKTWAEQRASLERGRKEEEELRRWFESLTGEQLKQLEEQLKVVKV